MRLLQVVCLLSLIVCKAPAQQSRPAAKPGTLQQSKTRPELTKTSFSANGLIHEKTLTSLYLGDFGDIDFNREDTLFEALFEEYLEAYAQQCTADLPPDKVEMMKQVCETERYRVNRYGGRVGPSTCAQYKDEGTGLYADPTLYAAKTKLDAIVASNALHEAFRYMAQAQQNPAAPAMNILNQIQTSASDMKSLLKLNSCSSPGLKRFQQNLMLFALGKQSIRLSSPGGSSPGKEQPAAVALSNNQNYTKLLDDLISQQSKTWIFNRFVSGSVSGVSVSSRDSAGHPMKVVAHYLFNNHSPGSVTVEFSDGLPECMYFFDLPGTCRTPDHRVVTAFANGSYQN